MKSKISKVLNLIIGLYLIFSGAQLIRSVQANEPQHRYLFIAMAVVFIIFGVISAAYSVFYLYKQVKREYRSTNELDSDYQKIEMDDIRIIDRTTDKDSEQE